MSFRWHADVKAEQIDAFSDALTQLPSQIPALLAYRFGPDLGLREGNADFAVVALLRTPQDVHAYLDHPTHVEVIQRYTGTMATSRSAVQFTISEEDLHR
ncbi:Dabb family protein [Mycolicibacterium goodii]|uniref:Dabb family protein n=1 Tax=Mycolicibacterium goodii TaxID=134601 RepID=UPI00257E40EF|nr:Dabb family protein [Mycolicibacterium goodii]